MDGAEEAAEGPGGADGAEPGAAGERGADEGRQVGQAEEDVEKLVLSEGGYGGGGSVAGEHRVEGGPCSGGRRFGQSWISPEGAAGIK